MAAGRRRRERARAGGSTRARSAADGVLVTIGAGDVFKLGEALVEEEAMSAAARRASSATTRSPG